MARAGVALLFGLGLLLGASRKGELQRSPGIGFGLAGLIGILFLLPWLLFGALGDWFDLLVAVAQALGLAVLAAGLAAYLMPKLTRSSANRTANVWLGGITLIVALAAIAGAWGQMDYQALLIGILPGLGFPLALLGIGLQGSKEERYDLWGALLLVFLVAIGPLAFADPRETRLALLFLGETPVGSFRATTANFFLGWMLLLIIGLFTTPLLESRLARHWAKIAGVAAIGAALLFFVSGQWGFYGDDFLVVFKAQADLTPAAAIADVDERRAWVYETLVAQADATQPDLMAWLDQRDIPYTRYYLVNAIEVQASALRRWQIAQRPEVDRTLYSPTLRPIAELPPIEPGNSDQPVESPWGIEAIEAPRAWSEFGARGQGVVVGHADSGVDASHPALAENYRGRDTGNDYNWLDPWFGEPEPYDANGHGTHTLATAVGQDGIGVAPDATWFSCANLVRGIGNAAYYLDCMQFLLAPYPSAGDPLQDGRPDLAADVSTNSWGCPPALEGCDQLTLWQATEALRTAGIFFVAGAGNEGPGCDSLASPPGNYDNVFSVGAIDYDGNITSFSSRGLDTQAPDGNTTPELLAPGDNVTSAWPDNTWYSASGTSMATPHVAGVVALMWSANPALRGDIDTTKQILLETATPYTGIEDGCGIADEYPDSGAGYGVVNAYEAVKRAVEIGASE